MIPNDDDNLLTNDSILRISGKSSYSEVVKLNAFALGLDISSSRLYLDLSRFTGLRIISMSLNRVSSLRPFALCKTLHELHLRKNTVHDISEVRHLMRLRELHTLLLSDNPCCSTHSYRLKVIRVLSTLKKLDSSLISEEEFIESQSDELKSFDDEIKQKLNEDTVEPEVSETDSPCDDAAVEATVTKKVCGTVMEEKPNPTLRSNAFLASKHLINDMSATELSLLIEHCTERLRIIENEKPSCSFIK